MPHVSSKKLKKETLNKLFDVGKHIIDSSGAFISRLSDDFAALHPYYLKSGKTLK